MGFCQSWCALCTVTDSLLPFGLALEYALLLAAPQQGAYRGVQQGFLRSGAHPGRHVARRQLPVRQPETLRPATGHLRTDGQQVPTAPAA